MNGRMNRRTFAAASAALASIAVVRGAARAAQFEYKYSHSFPVDAPLHLRSVQMWSAVDSESGGRLHVQVFPNGILGGDQAVLTQLRSGAVQFVAFPEAVMATLLPVASITNVGFAFTSSEQGQAAMDGALGDYIRAEIKAKNLVPFNRNFEIGMRELTSSTKPIVVAADMAGFKVRVPPAAILLDLFKTLGAAPTPVEFKELYTALQAKLVDGTELPLQVIDVGRIYEVQKYLSIDNHAWSNYYLLGNVEAWNALPPDLQEIVRRNADKYVQLQRADMKALQPQLVDRLRAHGLAVNQADTKSFRAALGPYYARWKAEFGVTAWGLMEQYTGKLG